MKHVCTVDSGILKKYIDYIQIFEEVFFIHKIDTFKESNEEMLRQYSYVEMLVRCFENVIKELKVASDQFILDLIK